MNGLYNLFNSSGSLFVRRIQEQVEQENKTTLENVASSRIKPPSLDPNTRSFTAKKDPQKVENQEKIKKITVDKCMSRELLTNLAGLLANALDKLGRDEELLNKDFKKISKSLNNIYRIDESSKLTSEDLTNKIANILTRLNFLDRVKLKYSLLGISLGHSINKNLIKIFNNAHNLALKQQKTYIPFIGYNQ